MAWRDLTTHLHSEAREAFAYLVDHLSFHELPPEQDRQLSWSSDELIVTVGYVPPYRLDRSDLFTAIRSARDDRPGGGDLPDLYTVAGLGSGQNLKRDGHTLFSLRRSLASQASAMRQLLPYFSQPRPVWLDWLAHAAEQFSFLVDLGARDVTEMTVWRATTSFVFDEIAVVVGVGWSHGSFSVTVHPVVVDGRPQPADYAGGPVNQLALPRILDRGDEAQREAAALIRALHQNASRTRMKGVFPVRQWLRVEAAGLRLCVDRLLAAGHATFDDPPRRPLR